MCHMENSFGLQEQTKCARDVLGNFICNQDDLSSFKIYGEKGGVLTTRETFSKTILSGNRARKKGQTAASRLKAVRQTTEKP